MARFSLGWLTVGVLAVVSSWAAVATAHEIEPAVADLTIAEDVEIVIRWAVEAPVAGIDLEGLQDTNAAPEAEVYDRLRATPPAELAELFRRAWPEISANLTLRAGGSEVVPELVGVDIPDVGNIDLIRTSVVTIRGDLPDDGSPVVFGWDAGFGPLVLRQMGVENGYTDFLPAGDLSQPIERTGGERQGFWAALWNYTGVGFDHIVPKGLDHILFVLGLFFLALRMGPLLTQVTAFTLAHTVTLALGATGVVRISPDIVEPLIAASIVYVGVENLLVKKMTPWRPFVVFGFGLLHGLGFASVLQDFGLGADHFFAKLIGFNIGVEVGQLAVILAAWLAFGLLFGHEPWYKKRVANPVSLGIAAIALFWTFERTGVIDGDGAFGLFTALTEGGFDVQMVMVACVVLALVTAGVALAVESMTVDDACGFLLSLGTFLGIVAIFTSGAWLWAIGLTVIWIVALRLIGPGGDVA